MRPHPFLAALILASACDSGSGPGQSGTVRATIYGPLRWGDVSGPLPGVNVSIGGKSEITNELGIAYISQLPSGTLDARIDRPGSELLETQVSVMAGDTVDLIEELLPFRPTTGRVEVLVAVPAEPGSPDLVYKAGASVTLGTSFRTTDANGAAEFPFTPAGDHWVRAQYEGAVPDSALVVVQGGDTARVNFRLGPAS